MPEAFLALGGNIGDVRAVFRRAIAILCDGADVRLVARSSDYRTPAWGVTDQPPFINAVIEVATSLSPRQLLSRALDCERTLGRDRADEPHWGPRRIDIDILAYDEVEMHDAELTLPHPRLFERAFVLVPLDEIAPHRLIAGIRVHNALGRIDTAGIEKIKAS
ncbi:MAG: 2-amino-4-hydroxy-6-hydroxymethyldihydropteridine diphosphokinase [Xanthobacteraceae bacterium]